MAARWLLLAGMAVTASFAQQAQPQAPPQAPAPAPASVAPPPSTEQQAANAAGFQEFSGRVKKYVQIHKKAEGSMPKLKSTKEPELIEGHQKALARKIRAARVNAKRGEIFTPKSAAAFKSTLHFAFHGADAAHAKATMQQGAPLKETAFHVNQIYPESIPYTSVPPTVLQSLPQLPEEVAYRIVGHDLLLIDVKANLVVDLISKAIPAEVATGQ